SQGGNRVGAMLYDNRLERTIPPRTGRAHVLRLTHELSKRPARSTGGGTTTDLSVLLTAALGAIRRRSLVFLVSDFISEPGWERPLALLARRHEVVAIRLVDPLEIELPDVGLIVVEDAETGEQLLADTSDPVFRQRLRVAVDAREATLQTMMSRAGVRAHDVSTDEDLVDALINMVRHSKGPRR
ncbi:MAG: DUF58 domain-containing protein, partial [Actinomycetota bacterium]|nr:DUF58 domain-containing protein [Actinomycetota bacterium]